MKNSDVRPTAFTASPASTLDLQPASRLIVLVPEFEADTAIVAQKIRSVAKSLESRIQLLGLSKDALHEPSVRRRLATLSAMVEDARISVESKVEIGGSWVSAIRPHWQPGDVIVCFAEHPSGVVGKPLYQILQSSLNATVYVLSGIQMQKGYSLPSWLPNILAWTGSIALIFGFFWLQVTLTRFSQDWTHAAMIYASIFIETASVWVWNNLFS